MFTELPYSYETLKFTFDGVVSTFSYDQTVNSKTLLLTLGLLPHSLYLRECVSMLFAHSHSHSHSFRSCRLSSLLRPVRDVLQQRHV